MQVCDGEGGACTAAAHRGRGGQLLQCQPRGPARMGGTHVCPFKILSWLDGMHSFSKRLGQHANTAMPTLRTGESWDQRMSGHSRSCLGWMVCTDPARGLVKVRTLQCRPRGPARLGGTHALPGRLVCGFCSASRVGYLNVI